MLLTAQRAKLGAIEEAARASGDLEPWRLCALALEEGPQTFDRMLAWVGAACARATAEPAFTFQWPSSTWFSTATRASVGWPVRWAHDCKKTSPRRTESNSISRK